MQRKKKEKITKLGFRCAIYNLQKFLKAWAEILAADNPKAKKQNGEERAHPAKRTQNSRWRLDIQKPKARCTL